MSHRPQLRKLWRELTTAARRPADGAHGHGAQTVADQSHGGHVHAHGAEPGCTALCCALSGQRVTIQGFTGDATQASRLRDLGLREGVQVTVLRDGDPLMVRVAEARFGIGRAAAMHVVCRVVE